MFLEYIIHNEVYDSLLYLPHIYKVHKEYNSNDKTVMSKVGERIRFLREQRNLSLHQLAVEAEISKNQVWRIEQSEHNTSLVTLNRIAVALKIDLEELFKFDNKTANP